MASGLPDYYRGVDIAYQALSQMIVRPKYGAALLAAGAETVDAGGVTTLVSIEGKGMIYGGILFLGYTSTQRFSAPRFYIDGHGLSGLTFWELLGLGVTKPNVYPVTLLGYDEAGYVYSVGFAHGITFEESALVSYYEFHGTTPVVYCELVYALV